MLGVGVGVGKVIGDPGQATPHRARRVEEAARAHAINGLSGVWHTVGGKYHASIIGYPVASPFQCWVHSDTSSSTCMFITPPALQPKANIEMGIQRGTQ